MRRLIVGVVGKSAGCPEHTYKVACAIGVELAKHPVVVLAGGHPSESDNTVKKGALLNGADQIAIRPAQANPDCYVENNTDSTQPSRRLMLDLNMKNHARNLLTGQVADVLIALPGGAGTWSEVACALVAGVPVVIVGARPALTAAERNDLATIETKIKNTWGVGFNLDQLLATEPGAHQLVPFNPSAPIDATADAALAATATALALGLAKPRPLPQWSLPGSPDDPVLTEFNRALAAFLSAAVYATSSA